MFLRALLLLLALTAAFPAGAQFSYPASASIAIGFAQLADGGPLADRWSTTIILTNPNTADSPVTVYFYADNGQPLPLSFGQGLSPTLSLTVPKGGVKTLTSTGTSSTTSIVVGWALVRSELPITGVALYRSSANGKTGGDVAAVGTGSTFFYSSYATERLGVAVGNPDATRPVRVRVSARNEEGVDKGFYDVNLPAHGHESFVLHTKINGLLPKFAGSVTITPLDDPPLPFGAWTLNSRDDVLSTLPPGEMASPGPHNRRPYDIALMVQKAGVAVLQAQPNVLGQSSVVITGILGGLNFIVDTDPAINASCRMVNYGAQIHVTTGMLEALGASDAALAFVIAHYAMRGVYAAQAVTANGPCLAAPKGPYANDPEGLSDAAAEATLLQAGFDPGGATDFYHRMLYASIQGLPVDNALKAEFGIPNDIPARLAKLWNYIGLGCSPNGGLGPICDKARKYWHPHNPAAIP